MENDFSVLDESIEAKLAQISMEEVYVDETE
jgi:hypothetical protein